MASRKKGDDLYIYKLPYKEIKELCRILDRDNMWKELGGTYMKFDVTTIHELSTCVHRDQSPTERLLSLWSHQNHTVTKLFILLSKMRHYRAMLVLKPFVDAKFHPLLFEGEQIQISQKDGESGSGAEGAESLNSSRGPLLDKDMNVGSVNLNVSKSGPATNLSKVLFPVEQVVERKILNTPGNAVSNEDNCVGAVGPATESKEKGSLDPNPQRKISNASDASSMGDFCLTIPPIEYNVLKHATNNWNKANIIGKGGFGTVFKGNWKNTWVAIKRIEQRGAESAESYQTQMEQSLRELRILNACRHDNILPIYGFSIGGPEPCLVYQFMPNGSLEDRLMCRQGTIPLTWEQRYNIAVGTARGLQFLHTNGKPFIHGDIKSANILLNNNFEPRIGDFGLAREGPQSQYTHMQVSRVHGTLPYLPDEFLRSRLISTKVDTFSFGIVLFELITGLRAYDDSRPKKLLKDHVESYEDGPLETLRDTKAGPCDLEILMLLLALGQMCVRHRARDRPEMQEVLRKLEDASTFQRTPQYPPQASAGSPSNLHPVFSPLVFVAPRNKSPEPLSFGKKIPILPANMGYPAMYQRRQMSPTFHLGLQHQDANYGPRMPILPRLDTGQSSLGNFNVVNALSQEQPATGVQRRLLHGPVIAVSPPSSTSSLPENTSSEEPAVMPPSPGTEASSVIPLLSELGVKGTPLSDSNHVKDPPLNDCNTPLSDCNHKITAQSKQLCI